jgi:hypothetical protein
MKPFTYIYQASDDSESSDDLFTRRDYQRYESTALVHLKSVPRL